MATQDIATLIDIVGVGVEWTLVGVGCFSGGQAGCLVGYWEAEEIWILGGPNSAETIFSNISAVLTISADYIDDRKLGEASATTFATAGAGLFSVEPTTDLLIDGYGTGYNHGIFCGISTILNCFSAP